MAKIDSPAAAHGVALDAHRRATRDLAGLPTKPTRHERKVMDSSSPKQASKRKFS